MIYTGFQRTREANQLSQAKGYGLTLAGGRNNFRQLPLPKPTGLWHS